jgi:peptide/nickel transport system substrate-binding protein
MHGEAELPFLTLLRAKRDRAGDKSDKDREIHMNRMTIALAIAFFAAVAVPAAAQKSKDTFRLALDQQIQGITPFLNPSPEPTFLANAVYDTVITFDVDKRAYVPLLAKSWKRIDDRTIDLELRDDVKWHDGEAFTADDVVFTYMRLIDPGNNYRFKERFNFIERAEKRGPYSVRIFNKVVTAGDLPILAFNAYILPQHLTAKYDDYDDSIWKPVGTGMFKPVQVDKNRGAIMERNRDYKLASTVRPMSNIGRLVFLPIPEKGTQVAQLLAGNIDAVRDLDLDQAEDLAKTNKLELTVSQATRYMYLALDAKGRAGNQAIMNPKVRRAIMMGINRPEILKMTIGDHEITQIPESLCWKVQMGCEYTAPLPTYDPAGARNLLAEAGYPDGIDLELTTFNYRALRAVTEVMANQLSKIGVRTTIDQRDVVSYRVKQRDGKIQSMVGSWPAGSNPDVSSTLNFLYTPPDSTDYHGDANLKRMARQVTEMLDGPARQELGRKVFDRGNEMSYFLPLSPYPVVIVHTAEVRVRGSVFGALGFDVSGLNWK